MVLFKPQQLAYNVMFLSGQELIEHCCLQVLLSYGSKSNAELLLGYGFVQPGNPHDSVRIGDMTHLAQDAAARGLLRPHWPPGSLPTEALEEFGAVSLLITGPDLALLACLCWALLLGTCQ